MNVYFTASIVGKKDYLNHYQHIINLLKTRGYTVQSEHIINVTEPEIHLKTRDERLKFHKKLQSWIQHADFVVVEASFPSISVGYEISIALQYRKPVLILFSVGDPPSLFGHHSDEKIVCEHYTLETVEGIVDEFIRYVHDASDTRFTFFVTPQIAAYLEKVSVKEKMPKSVYLRTLIENHIKDNPLS
jgi:hypothetical protein